MILLSLAQMFSIAATEVSGPKSALFVKKYESFSPLRKELRELALMVSPAWRLAIKERVCLLGIVMR